MCEAPPHPSAMNGAATPASGGSKCVKEREAPGGSVRFPEDMLEREGLPLPGHLLNRAGVALLPVRSAGSALPGPASAGP
jgi:hypothetical protein